MTDGPLSQKPAGLKITPQNSPTGRALCILGHWCLEMILEFSVFAVFLTTWSVLLLSPQVTGWGHGV